MEVEEVHVESEVDVADSDSDIEDCIIEDGENSEDQKKKDEVTDKKRTRRSKAEAGKHSEDTLKTEKISNLIQKVFFAHKSIGQIGWNHAEAVQIVHPRTKSPALFLMHVGTTTTSENPYFIFEVLTMAQDTRSWFIGDNVVSDGNVYTFTPIDPLFLVAYAMSKSTQARPLLDHLEEVFPRKAAKLLSQRVSAEQLENISMKKSVADIEAYVFSEPNTLSWLSAKVKKVAQFLSKKSITDSESSVSINFTKASDTTSSESTDYLRYAGEIVCEYVDEDLQTKLFGKLGLPLTRPKRKISNEDDNANKKLKTVDNIQPLEDYGSSMKSTPQSATKGGRGKAKAMELEKAAKGTHLLSKFFTVKPKP